MILRTHFGVAIHCGIEKKIFLWMNSRHVQSNPIQSSDTIIVKNNYNQMTIFDSIHMNNCMVHIWRCSEFTICSVYTLNYTPNALSMGIQLIYIHNSFSSLSESMELKVRTRIDLHCVHWRAIEHIEISFWIDTQADRQIAAVES